VSLIAPFSNSDHNRGGGISGASPLPQTPREQRPSGDDHDLHGDHFHVICRVATLVHWALPR
jgi:hypothetical protein